MPGFARGSMFPGTLTAPPRAAGGSVEFSLYVHIPFCAARCPYCDFTITIVRERPEAAYVDALLAELRSRWAEGPWAVGTLRSVYLGGGTPSILAPELIAKILDEARGLGGGAFQPAEITLEANPEGLSASALSEWREAGVNRLSLGAQSFDARHLEFLGRGHRAEDIRAAVALARGAGFENVSLDLIFGMPGQDLASLQTDLGEAVALGPQHVSAYNLTLEPGTRLHRDWKQGKLEPPEEGLQAEMFEAIENRLARAGLARYEISNFACPGFESSHNRHYWRRGSSLGIGTGAHSFLASARGGRRWWNVRDHRRYIARALADEPVEEGAEDLTDDDARREWVFLRLRGVEGFAVEEFRRAFKHDVDEVFPGVIAALIADGLVGDDPERVALTRRGRLLSNEAFMRFF
ncbi:MAG: radical SAM family heme chaperone HemW [Deltaproteobacteria bacterium]|nr:radical SAM family heme chaperone HemW [Deltaproteobacteria bacterium]